MRFAYCTTENTLYITVNDIVARHEIFFVKVSSALYWEIKKEDWDLCKYVAVKVKRL